MGSTSFVKFDDVRKGGCFYHVPPTVSPNRNVWDEAKDAYNASPVRSKAFCTLPRHEQVEIVRSYLDSKEEENVYRSIMEDGGCAACGRLEGNHNAGCPSR